ncbi:MAG: abortive infection family protein [Propionibacteriaceae bacterium]|nr:abortive infection family protein [Propionibacteriaceae bacterium]
MPDQAPVGSEVAGAFAAFFHGGDGPSHKALSRVFVMAGLDDGYQPGPAMQGPNKETRVLDAFAEARKRPATARQLVDELLVQLRLNALIGVEKEEQSENETRLQAALRSAGFGLSDDGQLRVAGDIDMSTGGRRALDEQLARLRNAQGDPALMIGTTKDLLEAVGKFVLEEYSSPPRRNADFAEIISLARERLEIKPSQVDTSIEGFEAIRRVHQSAWQIAESINELRNLQGTGHGRTLPTGVSVELARLVIREACLVADYMLTLLDTSLGKR